MKITRSAIVIPLATLLLVGGAGAVLAATAAPATPGLPAAPAADQATPAPASAKPLVGAGLTEVLDELVAKGTITAAQKTAIVDAVASTRAERVAEMQQIRGFLADGQITQDELNQLPADSPLRTLTSLMADGKITVDELRSLGRGIMRDLMGGGLGQGGRGGMMGQGRGGMMGGYGQGPAATPAP